MGETRRDVPAQMPCIRMSNGVLRRSVLWNNNLDGSGEHISLQAFLALDICGRRARWPASASLTEHVVSVVD